MNNNYIVWFIIYVRIFTFWWVWGLILLISIDSIDDGRMGIILPNSVAKIYNYLLIQLFCLD